MTRDLFLSTILSAIWISICFVGFGTLYSLTPQIIGIEGFFRLEGSLGHLELVGHNRIPWAGLLYFGIAMVFASAPINFYWSKRLGDS